MRCGRISITNLVAHPIFPSLSCIILHRAGSFGLVHQSWKPRKDGIDKKERKLIAIWWKKEKRTNERFFPSKNLSFVLFIRLVSVWYPFAIHPFPILPRFSAQRVILHDSLVEMLWKKITIIMVAIRTLIRSDMNMINHFIFVDNSFPIVKGKGLVFGALSVGSLYVTDHFYAFLTEIRPRTAFHVIALTISACWHEKRYRVDSYFWWCQKGRTDW